MVKNYTTLAWRNLLRNKSHSLINISGLAIGMSVAILIGLWVFDELNFNKSFKNYDRLVRIYHNLVFDGRTITHDGLPYPIGNELKNNYPEFENVAIAREGDFILSFGENKVSKQGYFVDPQFAELFSLQILQGSRSGLDDIRSIMLSRTLAESLIGSDAVGKMVKINNRDLLLVTAVFNDFPRNSQFNEMSALIPIDYYFSVDDSKRSLKTEWANFDFLGFALLKEQASLEQTESKIKDFCYRKTSDMARNMKPEALLLPMDKWHLFSEFKDGKNVGGKIKFVWMFGIIGVFVLLLACINFMTLSTARSEKRAREIGVRKVMGSLRSQLVGQFLNESLLVTIVAFVLAVGIASSCLPWFNTLADKNMNIPWSDPYFILLSVAFVMVTGILAGSYPALYLSSFNPVQVLKGTLRTGRLATLPRKFMVVFQFTMSIVLMIGTIVVFQQIQFAKRRPTGFDREGIIYIPVRTEDLSKSNYNSLRNDLLASGVVDNMAISNFPITGAMSANPTITWQGKDPAIQPLIAMNNCSHDFPRTSGFIFVEGRDFSRDFASDSLAVIVNETAAKLISEKSIIGKKITWNLKDREIIGVIKDQVRWSPFQKQSPHLYFINYDPMRFITIRLNDNSSTRSALNKIKSVVKKYDPGAPFDYQFVDDDYAKLFKDEERINRLASVFSVLAITISCIGIFGLASFAASQRTKEIGIRKVLGASVARLWRMLSSDFVLLVILAIIIASPIAYYFLDQWLQQYEYRIEISWWVFLAAGLGALAITLLTVSYQSIKAAIANPVKSLRVE